MATITDPGPTSNEAAYIMELMRRDIRAKLEAELESDLLALLRPKIKATVEHALRDMEPQIQAFADRGMGHVVVQLTIKDPEVPR